MSKRVEKQIQAIYTSVFKSVFTPERLKAAMDGDKSIINKEIKKLTTSKLYDEFARKFAKKLADASLSNEKGLWRKYYEAAKSKRLYGLPSTYTVFQKREFEKIIKHNFKMIKSIPNEILEVWKQKGIKTLLRQVVLGNAGRRAFINTLKEHGVTHAKLIARTETAKLQTAIHETTAKDLGSVAYIWRTSNDRRVRPSHKRMNDAVVFWRPDNEKPKLDKMQGNAGEFPNCRCSVIPIFNEDDLNKSTYNVYDYRTFKIIKMSKKVLAKALEEGHL